MLTITLADLRYRYRQFLIAVVGAGVVMGMAVLLSGLAHGFSTEIQKTVGAVGADRWLLSEKANGRLTAVATFDERLVGALAAAPGVTDANGMIFLPQEVVGSGSKQITANVMGVGSASRVLGLPRAVHGHGLSGRHQAVVDARTHIRVGSSMQLGSTAFTVVGTVKDRTLGAGIPLVYIPLVDAQDALFGGQHIVTAIVIKGVPQLTPQGLDSLTPAQLRKSTLKTLASGVTSIRNSRTLMWVVAAIIVAALIYVSALQRVRDFAVLKALGSSSPALFASLCLQAVIVTLLAAGFGLVMSTVATGIFPQPVSVPASAYITLPIVAIGVGVIASLVALRRATGADPVAAFGG
ncbi:MAG TPA: ABC transporter permease [Jatrophihabitantaceae bacterium]|nr:ABC transporter permease [Jatrophihabitantaceae bacterium]